MDNFTLKDVLLAIFLSIIVFFAGAVFGVHACRETKFKCEKCGTIIQTKDYNIYCKEDVAKILQETRKDPK